MGGGFLGWGLLSLKENIEIKFHIRLECIAFTRGGGEHPCLSPWLS